MKRMIRANEELDDVSTILKNMSYVMKHDDGDYKHYTDPWGDIIDIMDMEDGSFMWIAYSASDDIPLDSRVADSEEEALTQAAQAIAETLDY